MASDRRGWLVVFVAAFLSGCDAVPPEYEKQWVRFQKELGAAIEILSGGRSPLQDAGAPKPSPSVSAEFDSQNARNAKANAELLQEVYRVVFVRDPEDRGAFGSLVDSLNQGASVEGVYNGFTHSSDYRRLEISNPGASAEALRAFGEELALLELEMPTPIEFAASATRPLALPVGVGEDPAPLPSGVVAKKAADGVTVIEYGKPGAPAPKPVASPDAKSLTERYSTQFVGASIFTLKRVLGDEVLRVLASKKEYPEKLALWYSKWVVHMASRKVDFGIEQRNRADEAFHYKWALTATDDRLKWEVLNRMHRMLNAANQQKQ